MVALRACVSHFALCSANLPVLQAAAHVARFQVRKGERGEFGYNILVSGSLSKVLCSISLLKDFGKAS